MTMALLIVIASTTGAGPIYRQTPAPSVRSYVYEATETVPGRPGHGYRTEFDLQNSGGTVYAIVRKSMVLDGSWKTVEPDDTCRAAMHGDESSLARVKLSPLS